MRAVVCEDDVVVRGLVSQLAEQAGHEVIAETDNPMDAVDLVDRFGAGLVILDLSLPVRSGTDMLQVLRERGLDPTVVVFTAFASDEAELRRAGAMAVIEKPDFGALEDVLESVDSAQPSVPTIERRRSAEEERRVPAPAAVTPSGIESPVSFRPAMENMRPGDALVVFPVTPDPAADGSDEVWANVSLLDRRFAVARLLRLTLRVQDRLSVDPDGQLLALLVNGGPEGPRAVLTRCQMLRHRERLGVGVGAGYAVHATGDLPAATLARARGAAAQAGEDTLVPG